MLKVIIEIKDGLVKSVTDVQGPVGFFIKSGTETGLVDEEKLCKLPISSLNLSTRARRCMMRLNINTIGDLLCFTGEKLSETPGFGSACLHQIRRELAILGLSLWGEVKE